MRIKLTQRVISAIPRDKETYLWDTSLIGFGCRISPTAISWLVQKSVDNKAKRIVIGRYPPVTIEQARAKASIAIGEVSNSVDLVDRKQRLRLARREQLSCPSLQTAFDLYLKRNKKDGSYWKEVERKYRVEILPALGSTTRLNEITKADIRALID